MTEFVRVKDKDTGHEYTVPADLVRDDAHEVIGKDATNVHGDPLPPKQNRTPESLRDTDGEPLAGKTVPELRDYAETHQIDLAGASKKDDILDAVAAHEGADPA